MRAWVALAILAALGFGVYKHFITFDPLSFVVLIVLFYNNNVLMQRQQALATFMSKSQEFNAANQKILAKKMDDLRAELRKK